MKILIKLSVTIFFLYVFTACSISEKKEVEIVDNNFSKTYCSNDSALRAKLTINLQTIRNLKNKVIQEFINDRIKDGVFSQLTDYNPNNVKKNTQDSIAVNFFNEYKSFLKDFPDYQIPWEISVYDSVIFLNNYFVTVKTSGLFFTGGAHPNSFSNFQTYNITSVIKPTLQNIFKADFKSKLLKIAEKEFRKQKGLSSTTDLNKAGYWFKNNKFSLNNNWGIVKTGILFFYNDYEIAPHSMGTTTLIIPFHEIKKFILNYKLLQ